LYGKPFSNKGFKFLSSILTHPKPQNNFILAIDFLFSGYMPKKYQLETLAKLIQSQKNLEKLRLVFK
jgi:pyridoxal/pyridoxine/pyridoxamine kinase